jgi:microcystin-dependent protein
MPSTFSTSLRIELIGDGEQAGVWGNTTNNNMGDLIEQAIAGRTTLNVTSGDITLTSLNGVVDQARSAVLAVTGTPGVTRVLTIPNVQKSYTVINETTNIIQVKTASGAAFNCPPSTTSLVSCDGLNGVQGSGIASTVSPAFTGVPTAPTAAVGTNTTQIATTAFVQSAIPVGLITMWSGSIVSIPAGWALCNGTSGTPDLRDRFVVGAGSTYAVGATGGENTVTLDTTQIPSHTHTGTTANTDLAHTHTGSGTSGSTDLAHTHTGSGTTGNNNVDHSHSGTTAGVGDHQHVAPSAPSENASPRYPYGAGGGAGQEKQTSGSIYVAERALTSSAGAHSHTFTTGGQSTTHNHAFSFTTAGASTSMAHTHTFSFTTAGASISMSHNHTFTSNATGGGLAHENRPPYFALAYIMRVA